MENKRCFKCSLDILPSDPVWYGLHDHCFCQWFELKTPMPFEDLIARTRDLNGKSLGWEKVISSFFHGKFKKYSASLNSINYLLKIEEKEYPELPAGEYLCNQLALTLGISVPKFYLLRLEEGPITFVCYNFMQNYPGGNLIHIYRYLKTCAQYNCECLSKIIQKKIKNKKELIRFIHLTLFDSLIGNHDRHGRNLAFIQSHNNKLSLAPFYDNPSYLALEDERLLKAKHEPRGAIATKKTNEPTMNDYVIEWKRLGYAMQVENFVKKINVSTLNNIIEKSYISSLRKQAFILLIKRRFKELQNAL